MTDERLAEIRARAEAATPGPWFWEFGGPFLVSQYEGPPMDGFPMECDTDGSVMLQNPGIIDGNPKRHEDGLFMAHARQDIPDLLAEVERLRVENARLAGVFHAAALASAPDARVIVERERLRKIAADFWAYHEAMLEAAHAREGRWVQQPTLDAIYDRLLESCAAVLGKANPLEG